MAPLLLRGLWDRGASSAQPDLCPSGGLSWVTGDMVTIAGVRAVKGILTTPSSPNERVILAISPDPAVPYPVLIRQERNEGGNWVPTHELVLSRYEHHR